MKRGMKKKVYDVIVDRYLSGTPVYLTELACLTGLSYSTILKIVKKLIEENKVSYFKSRNKKFLVPNEVKIEKWTKHVWSDEEDIALIELNDLSCSELSKILKRTVFGIQHRRKALDLKKSTKHLPKYLYKLFLEAGLIKV